MPMCLCVNGQQMELMECRLRLEEERRARLKAESKLMEVNCYVRTDSLFQFFCILLQRRKESCLHTDREPQITMLRSVDCHLVKPFSPLT